MFPLTCFSSSSTDILQNKPTPPALPSISRIQPTVCRAQRYRSFFGQKKIRQQRGSLTFEVFQP
jgi:hypothetical protein